MSDTADGLRRFADVVDTFAESPIDVDSAQLLEADENKLRGQLTVTVRDGDLDGSIPVVEPEPQVNRTNDSEEGDGEDTSPIDEAVCDVDGCDYSGSERGLAIHKGRAHPDADGNNTPHSLEEQIVGVLEEEGEVPSKEIKLVLGASDHVWNILSRMQRDGRIESRKDPEDQRRRLYRLPDDNGTSTEDNESEAHDLEEDAADDAPAGTGDDVQEEADEITVDAVDGEKDEPDIELPDGVTAADVRVATDEREGLGDVADDLGITRGRARAITVALDCYGDVRDIPGGRR